ncbi:MAG: beta-phosphoglucomutase family hydrolase [Acidobacteria bacterium]|nr:beta-phosphoglucomutase family hydrolase [Acidobacteriota bacterium]
MSPNPVTRNKFDAVLFDLDGVLTATAKVHAACWKEMFDAFLLRYGKRCARELPSFDIATDYRLYVDGKPRLDGVRDFLKSREIDLPEGEPGDGRDRDTLHGLGNYKNELVNEAIEANGVEVYPDSIECVRRFKAAGLRMAVVTSSRNCDTVLHSAGIGGFFDVRVDGNVIRERGLRGKPEPDSFLFAAELLGAEPARAVVIEDAISGVQAGRAGGFGLVVGVGRHGNLQELRANGADIAVRDLSELPA